MVLLALRYAFFALIATAVNLGTQWLGTSAGRAMFCPGADNASCANMLAGFISAGDVVYWGALLAGTGAGFLVKYVLDKKFIFYYRVDSFKKDLLTFMLYLLMALATTVIFWGVQLCFKLLFAWEEAKYLGGFIGLVIGYTLKYFLDKRFVFVERKPGLKMEKEKQQIPARLSRGHR